MDSRSILYVLDRVWMVAYSIKYLAFKEEMNGLTISPESNRSLLSTEDERTG